MKPYTHQNGRKIKSVNSGKKPVKQTPNPNKANEKTAKVCSLITNKTNIEVNRKPGTSLRLCKKPISTPVKAAFYYKVIQHCRPCVESNRHCNGHQY